jgi:acyl carrier protein
MTDQQQEYFNRIKIILSHHFEIDYAAISWNTDIITDLGFSLIQFAELTIELERIFMIGFKDTDVLYLTRIDQLVNYIIIRKEG